MTIVRRSLEEIKERAADKRVRLQPWSDEKIKKAAAADPDTWLPTERELEKFKLWKDRAKMKEAAFSEEGREFDDGK